MLNRKVRNLAVAGLTIVSAAVLPALDATTASASTNPKCVDSTPRACVQVFGNGTYVADVNGWAWNTTGAKLSRLHIELYIQFQTARPPGGTNWAFLADCGQFTLAPHRNSADCSYGGSGGFETDAHAYVCAAVWQYADGRYHDRGYSCARIALPGHRMSPHPERQIIQATSSQVLPLLTASSRQIGPGVAVGRYLVSSGEFTKSFTTFHSLSPELSMSLWPTPGRLTSRVWPLMALVSSFAIQGRVSASSDPLMIRVGHSTLLALERASNGPMANEVLPMRARSIAQASRLVNGLSSTCALISRRLARSIATALPRDQPISVTWSVVIDARRCRYVIAASAER
jgi:hypothetical protein